MPLVKQYEGIIAPNTRQNVFTFGYPGHSVYDFFVLPRYHPNFLIDRPRIYIDRITTQFDGASGRYTYFILIQSESIRPIIYDLYWEEKRI